MQVCLEKSKGCAVVLHAVLVVAMVLRNQSFARLGRPCKLPDVKTGMAFYDSLLH